MRIPESISKWLPVAIGGALLSLYGFVFQQIYQQVGSPFLARLFPSLLTESQRGSIRLLLLSLVVSVAWVAYLHVLLLKDPRRIRRRYTFNQKTGISSLRGVNYCSKCLMKPECLESPLRIGKVPGWWVCDACGAPFQDENYIESPAKPRQQLPASS